MATTSTTVRVSIPDDLLDPLDQVAAAQRVSRDEYIQTWVNRLVDDEIDAFLDDLRWRAVQAEVSANARAAGLDSEDDIEDYIDQLSE